MAKVEVKKAREFGLCFGVRRAIRTIERAAAEHGEIATLGPIVHNRLVVAKLAHAGVKVISQLDEVQGNVVGISSHGAPPQLLSEIKARNLHVIDTTCPIVGSAQKAARKLAQAGLRVIIFGEATHPEVKGLLGWAGDNAIATLNGSELAGRQISQRLGILAQTTQSQAKFAAFIGQVVSAVFPRAQELRIINTLCQETRKRQEAAVELAQDSELMIVVGGRNSANTKRLAEVCSAVVTTHLIETAAEIQDGWLSGKQKIGVTAGASTPDEAIEETVAKLQYLADVTRRA